VIDKNIDVWPVIPMIQHTPTDPGRTLGGGKTVASPKQFWGGWHISYNRMNFREDLGWKDHSTFQISPDPTPTRSQPSSTRRSPFLHDQHGDSSRGHADGGVGLHVHHPPERV